MIRLSLGFLVAASLAVGCATAVAPDGGGGALQDQKGDSGASTGPSSYGDDGDGGSSGTSTGSDGGKATGGKDSGTTGTGGGACSASGVLATFDFTGEPGDQSSTAVTSTAAGISAGSVSRSSSVTGTTGADSINSTGWATGSSADGSKYYTFTITPDAACTLDITKIAIDTKSSGTGPTKGAVATDDDSFGTKTGFTANTSTNVTLSVSGASGAVEIRVYGFSASSGSGTFRVQNTLTVSGALH